MKKYWIFQDQPAGRYWIPGLIHHQNLLCWAAAQASRVHKGTLLISKTTSHTFILLSFLALTQVEGTLGGHFVKHPVKPEMGLLIRKFLWDLDILMIFILRRGRCNSWDIWQRNITFCLKEKGNLITDFINASNRTTLNYESILPEIYRVSFLISSLCICIVGSAVKKERLFEAREVINVSSSLENLLRGFHIHNNNSLPQVKNSCISKLKLLTLDK